MLPHGVGLLTVFDYLITKVYNDIIPYMYVGKQCAHGVGHFLCFDTSQCQFPHTCMSQGGKVGVMFD